MKVSKVPVRRALLDRANAVLPTLPAGEVACFALPEDQPERRICYQAVSAVANRVWGPGRYHMSSAACGVHIVRAEGC